MPSVLECVSEMQTNRVWPAGFGVSYGIGSTLKQIQRSRNSYKVKSLTSIISNINTNPSTHQYACTPIYTQHAERNDWKKIKMPKLKEGPRSQILTW